MSVRLPAQTLASAITPPSSSFITLYFDSATSRMSWKDVNAIGSMIAISRIGAVSVADQVVNAATLTLITGSVIPVPAQGFSAGLSFRWKIGMTKSAAGIAARTFFVRIGTAGTIADTAVATFTNAAVGTAAIDQATMEVELTVRTIGAAATAIAYCTLFHNGNTVGFLTVPLAVTPGTMATWNSTTAGQFVSLSVTTGASEVITVQECISECLNPANP